MTGYRFLSTVPFFLALVSLTPMAHAKPAASPAVDVRSLLRQALRVDMELELDPPSALERATGLALAMRQVAGIDGPECQSGRKGERDPVKALLACAKDRGVDLAPFLSKGIAAWLATFDPQAWVYSPDDIALMGATSANGRGQDMAGVIGIALQQQGNVFAVVGVLNGMPADTAGITRYMRIAAIDGISVSEMTIDQGMTRLRGAIGSTVSLTVLDGKGGSRTVSLVRRAFAPQPPKLEIMEHGRIGIVATSGSPAAVLPAVAKSIVAANPAPSWIILDLRHDSGGILQDYIATADVFLSQGRIVTVHGHPDEFYDAHAVNDPALALPENVPLVVLVDHVTAAGAELVAAALQDHRRATIIGQKTFGRGSVQTLLMLGQGWAMKMTTGYLARPDGPSLEYGVKPDCTSDLQDQALIDWVVQRMARGEIPCRATSETPLPPSGQAFLRNPVDLPAQIPQRRASPHGGG